MRMWLMGLVVAGCGGGGVSGPGEISFGGLTYDVRDGGRFIGAALTDVTAMPASGSARYEGPLRGQIGGVYRDGTVTALADFAAGTVDVSGSVDFTGEGSLGAVSFSQAATVSGNQVEGSSVSLAGGISNVTGNFYGPGGELLAGTVGRSVGTGDLFVGAFIAAR